MSKSKVYMYFIDSSLYAFTTNKEYRMKFENERNLKAFQFRSCKLHDNRISELMNKHHAHMMIEIPLHDGKRYYSIIGTYEEEQLLDIFVEKIYNTIDDVKRALSKVQFKKKYREVINDLTTVSEDVEINKDSHVTEKLLSLNLFFIFYKLFGKTFSNNRLEEDY